MSSKEARIQETYDALHAMPEVGFEEVKTSAWLAERIKAAGFAVTTGVGGTGIVAVLKGKEAGPVVALRADMDALAHVVDGKDVCVHSCGHDSHCTMVLTAAEELAAAGISRGTLKILFQPAEEKLFGATRMIEAGALDDVDIVLGIHLRPIQEAKTGQATPALYHGSSYIMEATISASLKSVGCRADSATGRTDESDRGVEGMTYHRRPQFFMHSVHASNDRKMRAVTRRHGNDGYATYFRLLEMMCKEDGLRLDLSSTLTVEVVMEACGLDCAVKFQDIIETCLEMGLFDKQAWQSAILFSPSLYEQSIALTKRSAEYRVYKDLVFERDGYQCVYCGSTDNLTLDHVVPVIRGGSNEPDNLACACKSCNSSKGARTVYEWRSSQ